MDNNKKRSDLNVPLFLGVAPLSKVVSPGWSPLR